jgi:hypothetical protein
MKDSISALVFGNGESRSNINLIPFYKRYTLIGCNAIFRDQPIDHLICCDRRMVEESLSVDGFTIYTRPRHYFDYRKIKKNKRISRLPNLPYHANEKKDQEIHWGSGPYAILLACQLDFKNIYLIGFDLYGIENRINNIYKGTKNYLHEDSRSVDPSYWIYQIKKLFQIFNDRNFVVLNLESWKMPREWKLPNVGFFEINKIYDLLICQ